MTMLFASVIVDVSARQTNRAFDYIVPERYAAWVEPGTRVGVPFGPRVVQGFVVGLRESSGVDPGKLREITQVLDVVPPLTPELVELGRWMSQTYMCHALTALQAMIPGALKAKYDRVLTLAQTGGAGKSGATAAAAATGAPDMPGWPLDEMERLVVDAAASDGGVKLTSLVRRYPGCEAAVKALIRKGALLEEQTVNDRVGARTLQAVFPLEADAPVEQWLASLAGRAKRQRDVLAYVAGLSEPVTMAELTAGLQVGSGVVKALAERGWLRIGELEQQRDPYAGRRFARTSPPPLTDEQQRALLPLAAALEARRAATFLLHGVTGSGKTEVYLQAIERCLSQGRSAIVLVPEIALTPQMVDRFKGRFGDDVAVLHSRLSQGERYDEWRKIQRGDVRVAVGARSAVFAPFANLGLIIMDEEHESSYKQEESPKYHTRAVAEQRMLHHGGVLVLGSATPAIETYYAAAVPGGGPELLALPSRVEGRPLPAVRLVDLREELKAGNRSMFSRALAGALRQRLERGEQSVLLLNRRGYATFVLCRSCGYTALCPHCDIALTYHQKSATLRCHYCGYAEREQQECPSCGSGHIRHFGTGTQRVEEELLRVFPGIRVIRMDVDTTSAKGSHEKLLQAFGAKQADVLLGTQMIAKGLDYPDVTLVGVIAADSVLNLPDFRSAERAFQLLTQVAGRAGRHKLPGEVIIQTYNPDHYSMKFAAKHDYVSFARMELTHRKRLGYPPFSKLAVVTLSHERPTLALRAGEQLAQAMREEWELRRGQAGNDGAEPSFSVLGPVASPIPRLKDRYRFRCVVKYRGDISVADIIGKSLETIAAYIEKDKLLVSADVDPQSMM